MKILKTAKYEDAFNWDGTPKKGLPGFSTDAIEPKKKFPPREQTPFEEEISRPHSNLNRSAALCNHCGNSELIGDKPEEAICSECGTPLDFDERGFQANKPKPLGHYQIQSNTNQTTI